MSPKKQPLISSVITVLLFAGILVLVNAFSMHHFCRIDLTESKKYTVSGSTKKILSELDDKVNIKVYMSKSLPPYLSVITDQIKDLLEEYKIYAEGRLSIEYIDPDGSFQMQQKLKFMGIPQLRLNIVEKDKAAITDIYMGLVVLYGDNKEIIPALTDIITLEYELTGKILRVTTADVPEIGFLSGHGELSLQKDLSIINQELQDQFFTRKISIAGGRKIPDDVAVLVVASPKQLSRRDLFEIDQYIMSGGKAIFLVDTIDISPGSLHPTAIDSSIGRMLEHYGVKVSTSLVLDRLNAEASFQSGPYTLSVPYPFWVQVVGQNIESDNPIIFGLESMVLPWASPVELADNNTDKKNCSILAQSSGDSWTLRNSTSLSPQDIVPPAEDSLGKHVLAVAVSGRFRSFFADGKIPPGAAENDNVETAENNEKRTITEESPETKLIVVGNARFITDNFISLFDGNRTFFLNAIDWLTIGDHLIDIRSRESGDRPLLIISDNARLLVRAVNILAVPAALVFFGLLTLYLHRRRKRRGVKL